MDEATLDSGIKEKGPEDRGEAGPDESQKPADADAADDKEYPSGAEPADPDTRPITKWEDVNLGLPEDARLSPELLADFGRQAVELGLNPKQARALAQWEYQTGLSIRQQLLESGTEQLKKAWGGRYEANRQAALTLVSQLDRELGDESFSKALNACGAAYQAPIVMALAHLAGRLAEDSMGKSQPDAASRPETALEGLENALAEARRK